MNRARRAGWAATVAATLVGSSASGGEREWPDLVEPEGDSPKEAAGGPGAASDEARPADQASAQHPLSFEAGPVRVQPIAQYRLRYRHHEGHDLTSGGVSDTLRHRARLGLALSWPKWSDRLGVHVELQDVRTFGEETDPVRDYSADGFDLHQGYAYLRLVRSFTMQLGRQEIGYENGRLLGISEWRDAPRSLDAIRFLFDDHGLRLDSFYAKIRETNVGLGIDDSPSGGRHLLAGNVHYELMPEFAAGIVATSDLAELQGGKQTTAGGIVTGVAGSSTTFHYGAEAYYQFGSAYGDTAFSSYLVGAEARLTLGVPGKPYVEAFGAFLSGDDDPDDLTERTFEVPFAGNHRFYGEMDFFTNMPRDTDERGLRDLGGALGAKPAKGLHLRAAYHLLQAMADRPDGLRTFGHELDVKAAYRFWTHASASALYGVFVPQGLAKQGVADPGAEHHVLVTMDVDFR